MIDPRLASALRSALEPIVREAGDHLLASFGTLSETDVERKGVIDLVTRLDLEAQQLLQSGLARSFPGETVVAEESAIAERPRGGVTWLVDPLDGTTNYVHGIPMFAVSVARVRDGELELAMVYAPYLRELFWAAAGQGASLNDEPLHVATRTDLSDCLLATGFPYDIRTNRQNNLREWSHFAVRCRGLRRCGSAALDLAYVAAGRLDGYWEFRLSPWDLAAGALLVSEAGGIVSEPENSSGFLWSGNIVAANRSLHPILLRELQGLRLE